MAHPGHLRLIFRSKKKNDRVDAQKLAKLIYLGEIPTVHVPSPEVRVWRGTAEHRTGLVRRRTRVKNRLRALRRSGGVVAPSRLWTIKGRQWLQHGDYAAQAMLQWFITEQVEEEQWAAKAVGLLDVAGDNRSALLMLDAWYGAKAGKGGA